MMANTFGVHSIHTRITVMALIMMVALVLSFAFTPDTKMSKARSAISFEQLIPQQFNNWSIDTSAQNQLIDPEVKTTLESVYSQTVSRTYINPKGQRIMLSVAYGGDQEEVMQVHKPEVCYTAQGFTVKKNGTASISTKKGTVLANQLLTKQAERIEPVTYWITIGNSIALNGVQWRWERIKYGLTGELPDGLLFRVSSLGANVDEQYKLQQQFIQDLISNVPDDHAKQLIGSLALH